MTPRFTIAQCGRGLATTSLAASAAVKLFEELGVVAELRGPKKNRSFRDKACVGLLSR